MNKARRKVLDELYQKIDEIRSDLQMIMDEEQEAFDNLPESLQNGEKGNMMQSAIDQMSEADEALQTAIDCIMTAQE